MILDIYKDSLEYASKDFDSILKLGIFTLFSFIFIPIFFIEGYSYRVIKVATNGMINGDEPLPKFGNWKDMFIDGLKVIVVKLIYLVVPVVIFYLASVFTNNIGVKILAVIISVILFIVLDMFSMVAIPNMAQNDSFKSAFDFEGIFNTLSSIGWLRYFGFYIGLRIIEGVIELIVFAVLLLIFLIFLGVGSISGIFASIDTVSVIGLVIILLFVLFNSLVVQPFLTIFDSRSIGLVYNIR